MIKTPTNSLTKITQEIFLDAAYHCLGQALHRLHVCPQRAAQLNSFVFLRSMLDRSGSKPSDQTFPRQVPDVS